MIFAIVLSAGSGCRFNNKENKLLLSLNAKPLFSFVPDTCLKNKNIDHIVLVVNSRFHKLISQYYKSQKRMSVVVGSYTTRIDSLVVGISFIQTQYHLHPNDVIITLDGDRPFVSNLLINQHIKKLHLVDYTTSLLPIHDSIFDIKQTKYVDRNNKYIVQTPQCIKFKKWKTSLNKIGTDLFSCLEYKLTNKNIVKGELTNFKITTKDDYLFAKKLSELS